MPVTAATFRRIALSLPEASEAAHMGHPDFRVRNKIFATLGSPDEEWSSLKLTAEQQEILHAAEPGAFKPAAGAWGRRGWTHMRLAAVDATTAKSALGMAWRNTAPKALQSRHADA
ncbi:MAG TPA: MmcQ/YjbR family DNA-binding protein [Hyphomicrobiaceae bacterium]|nr:MmcQ/YjbR family DNA-binding protein [Hyphomicrobiaceae bacterium]